MRVRANALPHPTDWDDLRDVLAIARQGNLSRAASYLGVTRTTVGRRLRAIESGLGGRLFDRSGRDPDGASREPDLAIAALLVLCQLLWQMAGMPGLAFAL